METSKVNKKDLIEYWHIQKLGWNLLRRCQEELQKNLHTCMYRICKVNSGNWVWLFVNKDSTPGANPAIPSFATLPNLIKLRLYLPPFASANVQLRESLSAAAGAQRRSGLAYSTFHLADEECLRCWPRERVHAGRSVGGLPRALPNS